MYVQVVMSVPIVLVWAFGSLPGQFVFAMLAWSSLWPGSKRFLVFVNPAKKASSSTKKEAVMVAKS
jgi:hypothetical protein